VSVARSKAGTGVPTAMAAGISPNSTTARLPVPKQVIAGAAATEPKACDIIVIKVRAPILRSNNGRSAPKRGEMNEKKPSNPWAKSLLIWVGILFGLVVFVQMIGGGSKAATGETIPYSEFVRQVDEQNV
jgi:hypothetical protein